MITLNDDDEPVKPSSPSRWQVALITGAICIGLGITAFLLLGGAAWLFSGLMRAVASWSGSTWMAIVVGWIVYVFLDKLADTVRYLRSIDRTLTEIKYYLKYGRK